MDGYVTIGTKLDTKQLERDIKNAESQLKQYDREAKKLTDQKAKVQVDINKYQQEVGAIQEQTDKSLEFAQTREQVNFLLESEQAQIQQLNQQYSGQFSQMASINQKIKENEQNQKNVTKQIGEQKQKLAQANEEMQRAKMLEGGFKGVANTMKDVVKSALRWGIAIIGVRTAFSFLQSSISTMSQYNKQIGADMEYIRFALASTLEPVILRIIGLIKTLLGYINYIAKAWFGVNLFAGASVDRFKQNEKALGGSAKQAKELNKQIAGFDEMNVLQDNSSGGGGGGGAGGGVTPGFDLSQFQGEVPDWIKWIADNKDLILSVMAGIAAGLLAWKLGLDAITSLGIGILIAGIVYTVMALMEYIKDPSWKNFGKVLQGIGVAIVGLGILIGNVPLIIAGAIILIVGTIIKHWDEIKALLIGAVDWLTGKSEWVHQMFGDTVGKIYDTFVTMFKGIIISLDTTFKGLKTILDGIIQFVKGVFSGNWKQAWEGVKKIFSGVVQSFSGIFKGVITIITGIAKTIGTAVGGVISSAFKGIVNAVLGTVERVLNGPIDAINGLISVINDVPGVSMKRLRRFNLPRMAKGGIINQPGRGVMVGSAIAGERGAEGVIPLTDSQQMALLGEAIGRYITVNASITNTMNGRVISRELQKINNENDFAYNR